jgi:hypothetical protein
MQQSAFYSSASPLAGELALLAAEISATGLLLMAVVWLLASLCLALIFP